MKLRWALSMLTLCALACSTLLPPRPALEWDGDPAALVIEAYTAGGLVPSTYMDSYIPTARVWGDGRVIWVEFDGRGGRHVYTGQLSPDELKALLGEFVQAGFFGWADHYEPQEQIYDGATTVLTVNLTSTSKTVSEYMSGAPAKYGELISRLAGGAGAARADYAPTRGYLHAYALAPNAGPTAFTWPDERVGFTLAEVGAEGRYVEGEALDFAWQMINVNLYATIVSDGQYFQISLQVPGVTLVPPPSP